LVAHVATVAFLGWRREASNARSASRAGLPGFIVVGLPDKAVRESTERVRAALSAIGLALPPKRITVNLSPADLPKEGSHYDLPIALGLLARWARWMPKRWPVRRGGGVGAGRAADRVARRAAGRDARVVARPGADLPRRSRGAEASWIGDIEVVAAPDILTLLNTSAARARSAADAGGRRAAGAGARHGAGQGPGNRQARAGDRGSRRT
jgi:magnesium chelatase family protein